MKTEQEAEEKNDLNVDMYIPIASLHRDKQYNQVFLVSDLEHRKAKNGNKYTHLTFEDRTGQINGLYWGGHLQANKGDYVQARIVLDGLKDQFTCRNARVIKYYPSNITDYLGGTYENLLHKYGEYIKNCIHEIEDQCFRDLMCYADSKLQIVDLLKISPYKLDGSMAQPGGLLTHTYRMIICSNSLISEIKEDFMPGLVIAGCILKNIGWHTTTIPKDGKLQPRDAYYTVGIEKSGFRFINHLIMSCENDLDVTISESKKQAIENMCSNNPITLEAQVVAAADQMATIIDNGVYSLEQKQLGNWRNGLFVGHL